MATTKVGLLKLTKSGLLIPTEAKLSLFHSIAKTASFFLLRLLFISINLPLGLAWNAVVIPALVLPVSTWICWINYKNEYEKLLILQ